MKLKDSEKLRKLADVWLLGMNGAPSIPVVCEECRERILWGSELIIADKVILMTIFRILVSAHPCATKYLSDIQKFRPEQEGLRKIRLGG